MSLLLNGAKTMTFAGTEMQCLEIYTGEAYTFPLTFTDSNGNAVNCNGWTLSAAAKFYTVDNITYGTGAETDTVVLGNINLNGTQPNLAANAYTLVTAFTNANAGTGYLYLGNNITGTANTGIPNVALANSAANSTLVIVTLDVSRTSNSNASLTDINREPLGFVVRYQ